MNCSVTIATMSARALSHSCTIRVHCGTLSHRWVQSISDGAQQLSKTQEFHQATLLDGLGIMQRSGQPAVRRTHAVRWHALKHRRTFGKIGLFIVRVRAAGTKTEQRLHSIGIAALSTAFESRQGRAPCHFRRTAVERLCVTERPYTASHGHVDTARRARRHEDLAAATARGLLHKQVPACRCQVTVDKFVSYQRIPGVKGYCTWHFPTSTASVLRRGAAWAPVITVPISRQSRGCRK